MANPSLVLVEEGALVLDALEVGLGRRFGGDYGILGHRSPVSALATLQDLAERSEDVALLIAGQHMQEMSGIEFLTAAHQLHPGAKRVLLIERDYRASSPAVEAISQGKIDYHLTKPWFNERSLYLAVSEMLADWAKDEDPGLAVFRVVGPERGERMHELRDLLGRAGVPTRHHTEESEEGRRLLRDVGLDGSRLPVVVRYDGHVLVDPTAAEVLEALGANTVLGVESCDVAIVGAGPAGLAAAVAAASEGLDTVVLERLMSGGQAGTSSLIRNYPGFVHGVAGEFLADRACEQAWLFGASLIFSQEVIRLRTLGGHRTLQLAGGKELACRAVVLATGVSWRRLGIARLEALLGSGVFYGAAASEAQAMAGQTVAVVGAGNGAGQAAIHLAKHVGDVTIVARGDSLERSMSDYLIREISATPNIHVRLRTEVTEGHGGERLERITVRSRETGATETLAASALFVMIGGEPHTRWLRDTLQRNAGGFILTGRDLIDAPEVPRVWSLERAPLPLESSIAGVFAVGDVRQGSIKRVASAVGEGATAIQLVHQYLSQQ